MKQEKIAEQMEKATEFLHHYYHDSYYPRPENLTGVEQKAVWEFAKG